MALGWCAQVGSLIFFVPDDADCVGVFDASNQDYTELDAGLTHG